MGMPHHFWLQGESYFEQYFWPITQKILEQLDIPQIERMLHQFFFLGVGGEGDSLNLGRL